MKDEEFRRIYDLMKDTVYRTALTYVRNTSDALDIVQEVMLKLYRYDRPFKDDPHCRQWLLRVTVNQSKDFLRSAWFSRKQEMDLSQIPGKGSEEYTLLETVLSLPLKYRSVILLYYYEGYSYAETAWILGISEGAVKMRASRAREMLRIKLEKEEADEDRSDQKRV